MLMSVSGARESGDTTPSASRMKPASAKKKPVGILRSSMSGKPDIQNQYQQAHHNRHRAGPQIPAYSVLVPDLREPVYQALEVLLLPRLRHEAHQDRHHEARRPRPDRDPEVLRHR